MKKTNLKRLHITGLKLKKYYPLDLGSLLQYDDKILIVAIKHLQGQINSESISHLH